MDTHSLTPLTPETDVHPLSVIAKKPSTLRTYLTYGIIVILVITAATSVLFFAAKDSLPGEPLYRVKTEGIEQVQLFLKRSALSRATYNNTLLETRLKELQDLSEGEKTVSNEALTQIVSRATVHVNDTVVVVEKSSLSFEEKIHLLVPLTDITRTMEVLVDENKELSSIETTLGDNDKVANDALENTLTVFVEAGPVERVFKVIQDETQVLAEKSKTVAFGSTAQKTIARRAEDIADALIESDFKNALSYILKAQQAIVVDEYLFDAERGPIDGVQIEPVVIPEGS